MTEQTDNGVVDAETAAERKATERVILEQKRVIVLAERITPEQQAAISEALHTGKGKPRMLPVDEAWVEVSRQTDSSKTAAIELYAGKSGTADAKVGIWRAPSVTAWKGAVVHEAPPAPLVERRVIE